MCVCALHLWSRGICKARREAEALARGAESWLVGDALAGTVVQSAIPAVMVTSGGLSEGTSQCLIRRMEAGGLETQGLNNMSGSRLAWPAQDSF